MPLLSRCIVILFLICTGTSTFRARKWVRHLLNRHSKSDDTCPPVVLGSADYFSQKMSQQYSVEIDDNIYTGKLGPRNTTTAQVFFSNREFSGKEEFMPSREQDIGDGCMNFAACDPQARYRTYDGSCNNLIFPPWGAAGTAYVQLIPQHYDDGIHKVRTSQSGAELPSTRMVHTRVLPSYPENASPPLSSTATYFFVIIGQMVSHDVGRVMQHSQSSGPECTCCSSSHGHLPKEKLPSYCLPISVPANDSFYSKHKVTCISVVRSMTTDNKNCSISPMRHISAATSYLDLSYVYGPSETIAKTIRTKSNGKLRVEIGAFGDAYPPNLPPSEHLCPGSKKCCLTGDVRANQNGHPLTIHNLFVLSHNFFAAQLLTVNPHWDDERIFQEVRKILIAIWQYNIYSHYLPMLLGDKLASEMNMMDSSAMVMDQYDKFLNPTTFTEYTSCAFRAFHTMVPSTVDLYNEDRKVVKSYKLRDIYFAPKIFDKHRYVQFILGLATQRAQILNEGYSPEMGNYLFKGINKFGHSILPIDLQRGRDHGMPSYSHTTRAFGGPLIRKFEDLEQLMDKAKVDSLRNVYADVNDVDAMIGIMLEKRHGDSMGGFTFSKIVLEQFLRWRNGDRFFYNFKNYRDPFTDSQLPEIKKMAFSNLICLVTEVKTIQPNVLKLPSEDNKIQDCNTYSKLDFSRWAEPKS